MAVSLPRRSRRNPLSAWDRQYTGTVGSGAYYYGPMLKADAEEKFRAAMAMSDSVLQSKGLLPLPLTLVIRPGVEFHSQADYANVTFTGKLAAQTKSVGLLEYVYARTADLPPKPGDPNRETPHTLFNCLHRLCEFISQPGEERNGKLWVDPAKMRTGDIAFLPCLPPAVAHNYRTAFMGLVHGATILQSWLYPNEARPLAAQFMVCLRTLMSSGLKTASGRLGAIDDQDQALAEAFAKYCLSPGQVYDPTVPLTLNGNPLPLPPIEGTMYGDLEYIQNLRKIWGTILEQTVHSLAEVFGLFVRAYYLGNSPIHEIGEIRGRKAYVGHIDLGYDYLNSILPKGLIVKGLIVQRGQPLAFVKPRTFEERLYAAELYEAVSATFKKASWDQEHAASYVVSAALNDLLDSAQLRALKKSAPPGSHPEYRFLREKYAKPRNTPASIAKAAKVNAALDVLEAASKSTRPGLYSAFIQPQE